MGIEKGDSVAHALVDSGAARSLISRAKWLEWCSIDRRPAILEQGPRLKSLTGHELRTKGVARMKILGREVRLHVTEEMGHDMLLGIDVLKALGMRLNCPEGTIELGGRVYHWDRCEQHVADVAGVHSELDYWMERYPSAFACDERPLEATTGVKLHVHVGGHPPIKQKSYRVPLQVQEQVRQEIENMLESGIIRRSCSPWASPMLVVPKPDGKLRVCVDYRAVNNVARKDAEPLPNIQDIFDHLRGAKVFSVLDLKNAFWQVECDTNSREILAFATPWGLFEPNRMPFGFCNSPAVWQRHVTTIFAPHLGIFIVIYLDDVVVFSLNEEDHAKHLEIVFQLIVKHRLTLNPKKCKFYQSEFALLGYIVNKEGIRPDGKKVEAIRDMAPPCDVKGVQRFLGMVNYYRQCIPGFADLAAPLVKLTHKTEPFIWGTSVHNAWEALKEALTSERVMMFPDNKKPYRLYCDASLEAVGGVLTQMDSSGVERPIHYFSKQLSKGQKRWATVEREAFSIIYGLQKLRPYLLGSDLTIVSDHKPLKNLFSNNIKNSKIQRWAVILAEYGAPIEYCKGSDNTQADMLSRIKPKTAKSGEEELWGDLGLDELCSLAIKEERVHIEFCKYLCLQPWIGGVEVVQEEYGEEWDDPFLERRALIELQQVMAEYSMGLREEGDYVVQNQVLYTLTPPHGQASYPRIVLPLELEEFLIGKAHEHIGHQGGQKTWEFLTRRYKWAGMNKSVFRVIKQCSLCAQYREVKHFPESSRMPIPTEPSKIVGIDLIGPLPISHNGNRYAVMAIDHHSGYGESKAIPSKHARHVLTFLQDEWVSRHGYPEVIISDLGREFFNKDVKDWARSVKIEWRNSTPYHPSTNGKVERYNGTLKRIIAKMVRGKVHDWEKQLGKALWAYRSTISTVTGFSPFFLHFGRDPPTQLYRRGQVPPDFEFQALLARIENVIQARTIAVGRNMIRQGYNKTQLDARPRAPHFRQGQKVLVKNINPRTFQAKYSDGYQVQEVRGPVVVLQDKAGKVKTLNQCLVKADPGSREPVPCRTKPLMDSRRGSGSSPDEGSIGEDLDWDSYVDAWPAPSPNGMDERDTNDLQQESHDPGELEGISPPPSPPVFRQEEDRRPYSPGVRLSDTDDDCRPLNGGLDPQECPRQEDSDSVGMDMPSGGEGGPGEGGGNLSDDQTRNVRWEEQLQVPITVHWNPPSEAGERGVAEPLPVDGPAQTDRVEGGFETDPVSSRTRAQCMLARGEVVIPPDYRD